MTLADKIRSMTDEELSSFLCYFFDDCGNCPADKYCYVGHTGMIDYLQEEYKDDIQSKQI